MRRQDIQLLALARQGDITARLEAGRRYLLGADGFQQHTATGLDYLTHASVSELPEAARVIAESLSLVDLMLARQEKALSRAAAAGSAVAQVKLAAWSALREGRASAGLGLLEAAAGACHAGAVRALTVLRAARGDHDSDVLALLRSLSVSDALDAPAVALIAAQQAQVDAHLPRFARALHTALALSPTSTPAATPELNELIVAAVRLAEQTRQTLPGLDAASVEASLDAAASRGDRDAAYALGCALCGIACGPLLPAMLAAGVNMRKGAAFLLRAADAGRDDAWLHLYRLHADHKLSVANPQMARFFLEKAAARGQTEAQRKLGALMLRASGSLDDSEQAIHWLHQAATQGDVHAKHLLRSLVMPLPGRDEDAQAAIEQVRRSDPWLAVRLQLARDFGLTKLEALCVDPTEGQRAWGLVVGKNPFITQIRLSAARAVPATNDAALANLKRAAVFFEQARGDANAFEGDLRRRSLRQRRVFERLGLDEAMFFSSATATTLESFRLGPKWAFRAKQPLQLALAA